MIINFILFHSRLVCSILKRKKKKKSKVTHDSSRSLLKDLLFGDTHFDPNTFLPTTHLFCQVCLRCVSDMEVNQCVCVDLSL
ncbi:hypothetical protein HanRHA438_Chr14g0678171 [Helianthus annuus]|nr:hypothetical protein HanRHA438_Chr14g0678171 [Helianthus annuus]